MKSKDLKLFRKRVAAARRLENPLDTLDPQELSQWFHKSSSIQPTLAEPELEVQFVSSLSTSQLESCLKILQDNMETLYQQSEWGWNLDEKRHELLHEHARFILVMKNDTEGDIKDSKNSSTADPSASNNETKIVVAFCHIRFDWDDDEQPTEPVVYVYELQIHSDYQRRGMGQVLMNQVLPHIGRRVQLNKCMLTVFHHNDAAMHFYRQHCEFTVDASSPSQFGEPADYEILSRSFAQSQ